MSIPAFLLVCWLAFLPEPIWERDFSTWNLKEALEVLNDSPWAHQQTATRVVGGIGSGVAGEKEIFQRFYVRFLSARPIRAAFARVDQLMADSQGGDSPPGLEENIELDTSQWIVIAVAFRSNDSSLEPEVRRALQTQTTETMKTRAFLSTDRFAQLEIAAFYPALEDGVGAKFVFPRQLGSQPVVSASDKKVVFELDMPSDFPDIRTTFRVREMIVDGELVL